MIIHRDNGDSPQPIDIWSILYVFHLNRGSVREAAAKDMVPLKML